MSDTLKGPRLAGDLRAISFTLLPIDDTTRAMVINTNITKFRSL